jgi:hypothetical protein
MEIGMNALPRQARHPSRHPPPHGRGRDHCREVSDSIFSRVSEDEVMETILLVPRDFTGRIEEAQEQLLRSGGQTQKLCSLPDAIRWPRTRGRAGGTTAGWLCPRRQRSVIEFALGRECQVKQDAPGSSLSGRGQAARGPIDRDLSPPFGRWFRR